MGICFQHELKRVPITKQARFHFGIEDVEVFGEPKMLLPKPLEIKCKRKLVWIELTKIWRSDQNLVKGFILNSVKGGYAVAIAGYIAFLPKSLLFLFDSLTVILLLVVTIVSSLVHIYSISYMSEDPHSPRFFCYLSIFTFFMLMLVTGDNFIQLFLGWNDLYDWLDKKDAPKRKI